MKLSLGHKAFHFGVFGAIGVIVLVVAFFGKELSRTMSIRNISSPVMPSVSAIPADDPYGGSTPEETFNMFLEALRAGDVDLASKYFVVDKQKTWLESLRKIRDAGYLPEMVKELLDAKKNWTKTDEGPVLVFFEYSTHALEQTVKLPDGKTTTFPAGVYGQTIALRKNDNQKWKISAL